MEYENGQKIKCPCDTVDHEVEVHVMPPNFAMTRCTALQQSYLFENGKWVMWSDYEAHQFDEAQYQEMTPKAQYKVADLMKHGYNVLPCPKPMLLQRDGQRYIVLADGSTFKDTGF